MTTPSPAGESGLAEPSVAPAAAYRWYVLAILMVTYAVHAMDRTIINVLLEPIRREFHLNDSAMGLLTGLGYAIPFAIAGMPLGALIDRTNRRRLLAALVATWSLFTAFGGLARTYLTLLVTRMAVGAAESGSPPAALSLISDFFPARLRATAVSIFYIGAPLGGMAGAYMGGVVTASHGWRAALFAAAAPGLIMALMILMTVREPGRGGQDAQQAPAEKVSFGAALKLARNPGLACVLAALVIGALSSVGVGTWTPALLMRAYDVPVQDTGKLVALINLVGAGGTALGVQIGQQSGPWRPAVRSVRQGPDRAAAAARGRHQPDRNPALRPGGAGPRPRHVPAGFPGLERAARALLGTGVQPRARARPVADPRAADGAHLRAVEHPGRRHGAADRWPAERRFRAGGGHARSASRRRLPEPRRRGGGGALPAGDALGKARRDRVDHLDHRSSRPGDSIRALVCRGGAGHRDVGDRAVVGGACPGRRRGAERKAAHGRRPRSGALSCFQGTPLAGRGYPAQQN
jgi:predicted MFS family arabinose efflux permease